MDTAALVAATPATRQRSVDLLRTASLGVVVLGHWLMAVLAWEDGRPTVGNALTDVPAARYATWVLQVMPVFFVVGGVANALSLARWAGTDGAWRWSRAARLLRPTAVLLAVWTAAGVGLGLAGADGPLLRSVTRGVTQPLWFLAVYLLVVGLAPSMLRAHRRWGAGVLVVLGGLAVAFDGRALNYVVVWLGASQLGFWWADGTLLAWSRRRALALAGGGLAALALLTTVGGYPVSMVGLPGERSNMSPPTPCIVALTLVQLGLVLAARPALERWLARPAIWGVVVRGSAVAMTVFLWHLTALALVAVPFLALGFPAPEVGSGAWWALRPVWVAASGLVLLGIVRVAGPVEWRAATTRSRRAEPHVVWPSTPGTTVLGLAGVVVGLLLVATGGLAGPGSTYFGPAVPPLVALAVLAGGAGLLRAAGTPPLPSAR